MGCSGDSSPGRSDTGGRSATGGSSGGAGATGATGGTLSSGGNNAGGTSTGITATGGRAGSTGGISTIASGAGGTAAGGSSNGGRSGSGGGGTNSDGGMSSGGGVSGGVAGGATGRGGTAGPDAGFDTPDVGSAGGAGGLGGASGVGGALVQAYDGARGKSFNEGWKFYLGDATGAQQPTFSDAAWTSLSVPHDWSPALGFNKNSPGGGGSGFMDGGVGWYRKTFTLDPSDSGKRVLIEFDGVYMNSQVWINGTSLGTWPYGYTTFQYDLTPYVKFDDSNVLAVRVDNKQPNSRWYTGSGIYRNVWLTVLNPVHISFGGAFITTPTVSATSATVAVTTEIENHSASSVSVKVRTSIYDGSGALVASDTTSATEVPANGKTTLSQKSLTVSNPRLWSIESPTLYRATVELQVGEQIVDTYTSPFGLRWTKFDPNTGFYLNDKSVKIWGQCMHHDLGALGAAVNVRAIERQLQILKGMGTNGIRTSHNPPAPELLDLADRMGFLIMDESFDVWEQGKDPAYDYHLHFNDWAERDIQAHVRRDRKHPSVIMWSIGNEIAGATVATATKLRDWVKALDNTRPVTWGANHMKTDQGQRAVAAILDLQGYNYFVGDANTDTGSFQLDSDHKTNATWKIFGSEELSNVKSRGIYYTQNQDLHWTGCQASTKQCTSYDVGWGDGFNTQEMFLINLKRPFFFGQFDWTGFDYGGEPTPYGGQWPAKSSYFGIVDTAGFPKDTYYFYQSKLTTEPMVHILPHWNWSAGTTVWVWVYSNCDSVELFLNDKSQGSKAISPNTTTRLEWNVSWASGTLRAEGKRGGTVVATQEIKTAGQATQVKLTTDRTEIAADGRDLVFITADIQDGSGVFVPTATNNVAFAVSGPGKLVGVDNGDPTDTTAYTSPKRNAFSGKVLAIIQSTGVAGQITVTATSSGLTQGSMTATAK